MFASMPRNSPLTAEPEYFHAKCKSQQQEEFSFSCLLYRQCLILIQTVIDFDSPESYSPLCISRSAKNPCLWKIKNKYLMISEKPRRLLNNIRSSNHLDGNKILSAAWWNVFNPFSVFPRGGSRRFLWNKYWPTGCLKISGLRYNT